MTTVQPLEATLQPNLVASAIVLTLYFAVQLQHSGNPCIASWRFLVLTQVSPATVPAEEVLPLTFWRWFCHLCCCLSSLIAMPGDWSRVLGKYLLQTKDSPEYLAEPQPTLPSHALQSYLVQNRSLKVFPCLLE